MKFNTDYLKIGIWSGIGFGFFFFLILFLLNIPPMKAFKIGLTAGISAGILVPLLVNTALAGISRQKFPDTIFQTIASHTKGLIAIGGLLTLSSKQLIFQLHQLNLKAQLITIQLDDIIKVKKYNRFFLIPNGLSIYTTNGTTYKFITFNRHILKANIENLLKSLTPTTTSI